MNTTTSLTTENCGSILSLSNDYSSIDVSATTTIIGSSNELIDLIEDSKFTVRNDVNLIITNPISDDTLSYFHSKTIGRVNHQDLSY